MMTKLYVKDEITLFDGTRYKFNLVPRIVSIHSTFGPFSKVVQFAWKYCIFLDNGQIKFFSYKILKHIEFAKIVKNSKSELTKVSRLCTFKGVSIPGSMVFISFPLVWMRM